VRDAEQLRRLDGLDHERFRAADVDLVIGVRGEQLAQGLGVRQTPCRRPGFEPVDERQPTGMGGEQPIQFGREDDGIVVPVGIDQDHLSLPGGQGGAQQGHHRGDPAAAASSRKSASGVRAVKVPAGGNTCSSVPTSTWSQSQLEPCPSGIRFTVIVSRGSGSDGELESE
jgi:hypothetical protein